MCLVCLAWLFLTQTILPKPRHSQIKPHFWTFPSHLFCTSQLFVCKTDIYFFFLNEIGEANAVCLLQELPLYTLNTYVDDENMGQARKDVSGTCLCWLYCLRSWFKTHIPDPHHPRGNTHQGCACYTKATGSQFAGPDTCKILLGNATRWEQQHWLRAAEVTGQQWRGLTGTPARWQPRVVLQI